MRWMREHARLLMAVTVALFIGGFIAPGILRYLFGIQIFGEARSRNVALVEGQPVSLEAFYDRFNRRQTRRRNQQGTLTRRQLRTLRRETLRELVDETLLRGILKRRGGRATPREIRQFFSAQRPFRDEQGRVDPRRVSAALQRMTEAERRRMEASSRTQIESGRAARWLRSRIDVTDSEARFVLRRGLREARVHGIFLDPRRFVADSAVRLYYEQHRDRYMQEPRAKLRQIFLSSSDTPSRSGGRLEEVRNTLRTIRRRFQAGESFARLARRYSEDPATARRGGLRGWVTSEELEDPIARAAFRLDPGEISSLVKTDRGYYLLHLDSGPVRRPRPLSRVRDDIRNRLLAPKHHRNAREKARALKRTIARAPSPGDRLRELAFLRSHSPATSGRGGNYGWVPYRFVVPRLHASAGRWRDELTEGPFVDPTVGEALFSGETPSVVGPVRSPRGYHLFWVSDRRPARLGALGDSDAQRLKRFIGLEKASDYVRTWLKNRRRRAEITIEASSEVVGGTFPWADRTTGT